MQVPYVLLDDYVKYNDVLMHVKQELLDPVPSLQVAHEESHGIQI